MKYIDAEKLKDEIKHLKIDVYDEAHQFDLGARSSLTYLESFIDSLQQEQPEAELEKEIERYLLDNVGLFIHADSKTVVQALASHFYELGKKEK